MALETLAGCRYDAWERAMVLLLAVAMAGLRQQGSKTWSIKLMA